LELLFHQLRYYTGWVQNQLWLLCKNLQLEQETNVIAGLATGMISTFPTVLLAAIWTSYALAGFYGCFGCFCNDASAMQLGNRCFRIISDNAELQK
jgi:K(+)-stimulated pyrophosphate-energized sodium pump